MSKVSFILPAYKRRFLDDAVSSILAQTCRDFELVVVDDCSPQDLLGAFDRFGEPRPAEDGGREWCVDGVRVCYYRNSQNLGGKDLVAAWSRAMDYATGEFSVLASDDDVYLPGYLEEMLSLAAKYPTVNVFHCREVCIGAGGDWRRVSEPRAEYETGVEMLYNRGVLRMQQTMQEFMFRTSALKAAGGFVRLPKAWMSDDATWMLLSRDGGAACSPRPLFLCRASGENISTQTSDVVEKLRAHEAFKKWVHGLIKEERPRDELDRFLLGKARHGVDAAVDGVTRWAMGVAPPGAWAKAIFTAPMPTHLRVECAFARLLSPFGEEK